jgi:hypothetical protein
MPPCTPLEHIVCHQGPQDTMGKVLSTITGEGLPKAQSWRAGSNRTEADGDKEEEDTESRSPDAATARMLEKTREDAIEEAQEAFLAAIFLCIMPTIPGFVAYKSDLTTTTWQALTSAQKRCTQQPTSSPTIKTTNLGRL